MASNIRQALSPGTRARLLSSGLFADLDLTLGLGVDLGGLGGVGLGAGAYTRPLLSSTCAVYDTKCTPNTPHTP